MSHNNNIQVSVCLLSNWMSAVDMRARVEIAARPRELVQALLSLLMKFPVVDSRKEPIFKTSVGWTAHMHNVFCGSRDTAGCVRHCRRVSLFICFKCIYTHTKQNFFIRTSFIYWTEAHVRSAISFFLSVSLSLSSFAVHFDERKNSKIFDLHRDKRRKTERTRERERKCSVSFFLLPFRPLEKQWLLCWMRTGGENEDLS